MSTVETSPCGCKDCRITRAGLGPGPYTAAEYARIAPAMIVSPNPWKQAIDTDPEVVEARQAAELARIAVESARREWLTRYVEIEQGRLGRIRRRASRWNIFKANSDESPVVLAKQDEEQDDRLIELADRKDLAERTWVRANDRVVRAVNAARRQWAIKDNAGASTRAVEVLEPPRRSSAARI